MLRFIIHDQESAYYQELLLLNSFSMNDFASDAMKVGGGFTYFIATRIPTGYRKLEAHCYLPKQN